MSRFPAKTVTLRFERHSNYISTHAILADAHNLRVLAKHVNLKDRYVAFRKVEVAHFDAAYAADDYIGDPPVFELQDALDGAWVAGALPGLNLHGEYGPHFFTVSANPERRQIEAERIRKALWFLAETTKRTDEVPDLEFAGAS